MNENIQVNSITANSIFIKGQGSKAGISLECVDDLPQITMYDKKGKARMFLSLDPGGEPGIQMYNQKGTPIIGISVQDNAQGLSIHQENGHHRICLGVQDGNSEIKVLDSNGQIKWKECAN